MVWMWHNNTLAVMNDVPHVLHVFILYLDVDCSVSFVLQRLWHPAVVSSSLHASANKDGFCPGGAHGKVPLVCSPVPSSLLLAPSLTRAGPLTGRLAGDGWHWGSFPWCDHLHHHGERVAGPQPPSPAWKAAELGFPASVDALSQTTGPPDHQGNRLL